MLLPLLLVFVALVVSEWHQSLKLLNELRPDPLLLHFEYHSRFYEFAPTESGYLVIISTAHLSYRPFGG